MLPFGLVVVFGTECGVDLQKAKDQAGSRDSNHVMSGLMGIEENRE